MATKKGTGHWLDKLKGLVTEEKRKDDKICREVTEAFIKMVSDELDNEKSGTSNLIRENINHNNNYINMYCTYLGECDYKVDDESKIDGKRWGSNRGCLFREENKRIITAKLNETYKSKGLRFTENHPDGENFFMTRRYEPYKIYCKWDKA